MKYPGRLQFGALGAFLVAVASHVPVPIMDGGVVGAQSSEQCSFSDFLNPPGLLDHVRNTPRLQEWLRYTECLTRLGISIEGKKECFIAMNPVYNPDTGDYDVESYVVCTSLL